MGELLKSINMNSIVFTVALAATASAVSIQNSAAPCTVRWTASQIPCLTAPTAGQAETVFNQISGDSKTFGGADVRAAVDEVVRVAEKHLTKCEITYVKNTAMGLAADHSGAVSAIKGGISDLKDGARVDLAKFTAVFKTAIGGINKLTGKCDGKSKKTDAVQAAIDNWSKR